MVRLLLKNRPLKKCAQAQFMNNVVLDNCFSMSLHTNVGVQGPAFIMTAVIGNNKYTEERLWTLKENTSRLQKKQKR